MVLRGLLLFFLLCSVPYGVASEQGSLAAGPSPFVLIARLHALPDTADPGSGIITSGRCSG